MGKVYFITGGTGLLGKRVIELIFEENIHNVYKIIVYDLKVDEESRCGFDKWCKDYDIESSIVIGDRSLEIIFRVILSPHGRNLGKKW